MRKKPTPLATQEERDDITDIFRIVSDLGHASNDIDRFSDQEFTFADVSVLTKPYEGFRMIFTDAGSVCEPRIGGLMGKPRYNHGLTAESLHEVAEALRTTKQAVATFKA